MTELELQELDKAVAAKYGIEAYNIIEGNNKFTWGSYLWLHNDSGRCFDLAAENNLQIDMTNLNDIYVRYLCPKERQFKLMHCFISDFENKPQAARVAVLRALLAKGE